MQDQGYRSILALHIPQEQIPFGGLASESSKSLPAEASTSVGASAGSGSGYGPPQPATATPLQRLAQQHLSEDSDFELLCAPLSNGSWRQRFERMCIASPNVVGGSDSRSIFAGSQQHLAKYNSSKNEDEQDAAETAARVREAELWRLSGCFKRGEVNATRSDETSQLLTLASDWLELDSEVEGIRFDSELALKQEVAYAAHLHVQTLILPPPRQSAYVTDYARAVASVLSTPGYIQIAIRLPISDPNPDPFAPSSVPAGASKSWEMWNTIRAYCSYNPRLSVCLELSTPSLPPPSFYERWHAEPIRHVFLPASAYLANAKGYPVLSKACQAFFKSVFKFRPTIIMSGIEKGHHSSGGQEAYTAYLRFLERKTPMDDPLEQFATGYMDFLQAPLQPLMDNLENDTYEGFERDPVKYRQYEEAVYQALKDRAHRKKAIEIFVCGAGRGPLVEGCLRASRRAQVSVRLTAVEKNPNAFVTLQERKATEWGDSVDLVFSDMRAFNPPRPADIIVSELLGSFGDNELSPECLDGVMRTLAPDGISIPCSYTSYLAPVTNQKLHSETSNSTDSKFPEQPYVVMFQSVSVLSATGGRENYAKFAECWGFDHPRNDVVCDEAGLPLTNHHNARSAHVTFHIPNGGICHGFGGYFEAILYNDIGISIHPERMDKNMLSWFPLFFPLKDPLYLPPRSELDVHIFRLIDGTKRRVWFEWSADVYLPLPSLTMASSPPASASMQTTTSNGTHPSMRVRGGSPMDTRSFSNASQGISPHLDNFASAPSPFIGNESMSSAGFMLDAGNRSMAEGIVRVKVGQSRLHNPAGRSSWVGL